MNIFCPLITHSSPSRTARVWQAKTSEPPSGSVKPRQMRVVPAATPGRILALRSSDAKARTTLAASMVVPAPIVGPPAARMAPSTAAASKGSSPAPPSSGGQVSATQPSTPIASMRGRFTPSPERSSSSTTAGVTCSAANASASARMRAMWGGSSKSTIASIGFRRGFRQDPVG